MKHLIYLSLFLLIGCAGSPGNSGSVGQQPLTRAQTSAKVHTELAGAYYERSQLGVALGEVAVAVQADPDYAPAYNVRGLIYMALREDKNAENNFQHSLSLDKTNSDAHNNYGWFLCQRGKEKESIPHFMSALKNPLYETPERAYFNAGICAMKIGNNKDAEDFLQRALLVRPGLSQAFVELARLNFAKGDYVTAKRYFKGYSSKVDNLTAEELLLAVRIERKVGDRNSEASYATQLRKRYPDSSEVQALGFGK